MGRSPCVLTFLTGLPQIPVSTIAFTWSLGLVKLIPLLRQHVPHHYILIECVTYCSKTTTSLRHVSLPWHLIDHLKSSSLVASTVRARVQRALFPLSWWRFNVFLKDTSTEWSLCTRTDWSCSRWTSSSSLSFYFFFFFIIFDISSNYHKWYTVSNTRTEYWKDFKEAESWVPRYTHCSSC